MTPKNDREHDNNDPARKPDLAKSTPPVVSTPAAGALVSLQALAAALNTVDTASVAGQSGLPMLQFKRDGNGTWSYGQRRTVVEDGSTWALNPVSLKRGFICFNEANKVIGERLLPVNLPMPDLSELPDKGFEWSEQWTVELRCRSGSDAGVEVIYKPTTFGGIQAIAGIIETIRERLNSGRHGDKVAPVVRLGKDNYSHGQYGKIWTPVFETVEWIPLGRLDDDDSGGGGDDGGGPAKSPNPTPPTPPVETPVRRRRVA